MTVALEVWRSIPKSYEKQFLYFARNITLQNDLTFMNVGVQLFPRSYPFLPFVLWPVPGRLELLIMNPNSIMPRCILPITLLVAKSLHNELHMSSNELK